MNLLHQLNACEIPLCLRLNRINRLRPINRFFAGISRLGNGIFWYILMLMLPLTYGWSAVYVSLQMAAMGLVGLVIYKVLKGSTLRVRPYHYHTDIFHNVAALDQFSFPSGHTLHAVNFSLILLHYYPEWAYLVLPFACLTALSRIVLGLHYPSDVLVGALIGGGLAFTSFLALS